MKRTSKRKFARKMVKMAEYGYFNDAAVDGVYEEFSEAFYEELGQDFVDELDAAEGDGAIQYWQDLAFEYIDQGLGNTLDAANNAIYQNIGGDASDAADNFRYDMEADSNFVEWRNNREASRRRAMRKRAQEEEYEGLGETVEEAFETLVDRLNEQSLPGLCDELEAITNDPKLYELLSKGFGNGELANVKMSAGEQAVPVKALVPLQREIGLDNSLSYPLSGDCSTYFNSPVTIVAPIISYNGAFIVDGHHRWSQLYMVNPEATISAINFQYGDNSPLRILRNFQGAIAVSEGTVPSQVCDLANVFQMGESEIRDYVESNITDQCIESLKSLVGLESDEEVVEYIVGNAMELKQDNPPYGDAPARDFMPQTTQDAIDMAEQGQTNI